MDNTGMTCGNNFVVGSPEMTVDTAARVMRNQHAGAIVVLDSTRAQLAPAGLVTDRDLVVHAVALGLDLKAITVGDMGDLLKNRGSRELVQMIDLLKANGRRQITVVDAEGKPAGLVSIEELVGSEPHQPRAKAKPGAA